MIINALITEYNPFHNGHIYHIKKSKEKTNADLTIAIMSGNFTQRGEIASVNKFIRSQYAIDHVDLVVELPLYYAISYADDFALGAVNVAKTLNATHLVFGSESGNISDLIQTYHYLERPFVNNEIQQYLKKGHSYPNALQIVLKNQFSLTPNNILGLSYIRAINQSKVSIIPDTIQRIGNNYNDLSLSNTLYSSATSIRKQLELKNVQGVTPYMPKELALKILGSKTLNNEVLFNTLKTIITTQSIDELHTIYTMEEGIEYRLKEKIRHCDSYESFINAIKTKRYTRTRLNRLMLYILFNISKEKFNNYTMPNAVRVLAMNQRGQNYLKTIKHQTEIITNVNQSNKDLIANEIIATDVFNIFSQSSQNDFNTPVIKVD